MLIVNNLKNDFSKQSLNIIATRYDICQISFIHEASNALKNIQKVLNHKSNKKTLKKGMRTIEDLLSLAAYCRDRVNAQMFVYSLSVAILHRSDTKHLPIPQLTEVFPDKYIDSSVFHRAKEEAHVVPAGQRVRL